MALSFINLFMRQIQYFFVFIFYVLIFYVFYKIYNFLKQIVCAFSAMYRDGGTRLRASKWTHSAGVGWEYLWFWLDYCFRERSELNIVAHSSSSWICWPIRLRGKIFFFFFRNVEIFLSIIIKFISIVLALSDFLLFSLFFFFVVYARFSCVFIFLLHFSVVHGVSYVQNVAASAGNSIDLFLCKSTVERGTNRHEIYRIKLLLYLALFF